MDENMEPRRRETGANAGDGGGGGGEGVAQMYCGSLLAPSLPAWRSPTGPPDTIGELGAPAAAASL